MKIWTTLEQERQVTAMVTMMVTMTEWQFLMNRIVYFGIGLVLGLIVSAYVLIAKDIAKAIRTGETIQIEEVEKE